MLARARPFADRPDPLRLVEIKPVPPWATVRDSEVGLGHGRYAYSVNAALGPASLRAALALHNSGLIDAELHAGVNPDDLNALPRMAEVWREQAPRCFEFSVPAEDGGPALDRAAAGLGLPGRAAPTAPLACMRWHSTLPAGRWRCSIPISASRYCWTSLRPSALPAELAPLLEPYPLGLMTGVGLLVANARSRLPRCAPSSGRTAITAPSSVWQQAMLAAGIARQQARVDLPASVQELLARAHERLWQAIDATRDVANSELWSWRHVAGQGDEVQAFGPLCATADESNAAQLWSTVYLAVRK